MNLMKKVNALVLGLAVLLAFGCGGDEPDKIQPNVQQNKCLVSKMYVETNSQNKTLMREWFYDNNKRNIRTNFYPNSYNLYEYDAAGLIMKQFGFSLPDSVSRGKSIHTYDQNGLIKTIGGTSFNGDTAYYTYDYNGLNQLIKVSLFERGNNYPQNFAKYYYHSNGKIVQENYLNINNNPVLEGTRIYTFDNKPTPKSSVVFMSSTVENAAFQNNVLNYKYIIPGSADTMKLFYSHQYNEYGYPISTTMTNAVDPSFYRKTEYEYICF